ncbi:polyisoprenoid-binding protein [Luteimonas viscosa]|uniref:Polyisoprenoid-binding protein n=1 Tax=Luteimonas viscosa TaxID=1132694 RepID=A0A5D4XMH7_9GAMM|nr:YceI family protein [Luteimonas viscosa]TYT25888.1 polyisoprenoid-binding protein [Luteimonas viscosa]
MQRPALLLLPLALTLAIAACSPAEPPAAAEAPATPAATADAAAPAAEPAPADAAPVEGVSGTYLIDPNHTNVVAQWSHFGFSNPVANFGQAEGRIVYDADNVSASSVEVTLPLDGLSSFAEDFNDHLRSADFFDAEKFPAITFKSTSVESAGGNRLKVTGDLTVKDITRPVVLDATINRFAEHPMAKRAAAGFDATTTLKRSDFGVGAYAPNVSDEVELRITTEAMVAAPEGADAAEG